MAKLHTHQRINSKFVYYFHRSDASDCYPLGINYKDWKQSMQTNNCPNCSTPLVLGDLPKIGELVQCQHCQMKFEVVWLFPPELIPIHGQAAPTIETLHDQI